MHLTPPRVKIIRELASRLMILGVISALAAAFPLLMLLVFAGVYGFDVIYPPVIFYLSGILGIGMLCIWLSLSKNPESSWAKLWLIIGLAALLVVFSFPIGTILFWDVFKLLPGKEGAQT